MTIKIIKEGIKNWQTVYRATCFRCKCIFDCDQSDGHYYAQDFRGDGDFVQLGCPNCGQSCNAYGQKIN